MKNNELYQLLKLPERIIEQFMEYEKKQTSFFQIEIIA